MGMRKQGDGVWGWSQGSIEHLDRDMIGHRLFGQDLTRQMQPRTTLHFHIQVADPPLSVLLSPAQTTLTRRAS